jgi:hypothetical protein
MSPETAANLDGLRERVTPAQREFLDWLWTFYCSQGEWALCRFTHQRLGKAAVHSVRESLGEDVVGVAEGRGREQYRLTFLGALLTSQGQACEDLLVRYLEYVRAAYRANPALEWVASQDVEAALGLRADQSALLRHLVRLSHWWGGGSAFTGREWTVGIPMDVEELLPETDLRRYVRGHVLAHFPAASLAGVSAAGSERVPGGAFWFVADAALRARLAEDWHEAQDVFHVRGWRSCVVLCGGVLEALLLEALPERAAPAAGRARRLAALIAAAAAGGILDRQMLQVGQALDVFPALIRPSRKQRGPAVSRAEAEEALQTVRLCLHHLEARARQAARA